MPRKKKKITGHAKKKGPSPLYNPADNGYAEQVATMGATVPELATAFGVSYSTIEGWMRNHPAFSEAIKRGRWQYDTKFIESGLRQRATGFEYDEVTIEAIVIFNGDDEDLFVEKVTREQFKDPQTKRTTTRNVRKLVPGFKRKVVTKHVIPDVAACIFWLCNRQSGDWQQTMKQITENTSTINHKHEHELDLTKLSRKQLEQLSNIVDQAKQIQSDDRDGKESPIHRTSGERRIGS